MIPHLTRSHSKDDALKDRVQRVPIIVTIWLVLLILYNLGYSTKYRGRESTM